MNREQIRSAVDAIVPGVHRCEECGAVLSMLPTTWICLNEECSNAGVTIPRKSTEQDGGNIE
jgi:hypothetical protein